MVIVKIKNKPNELKAINFLGKYSQNKGLLDEVIKTLDWLDKSNKKNKKETWHYSINRYINNRW